MSHNNPQVLPKSSGPHACAVCHEGHKSSTCEMPFQGTSERWSSRLGYLPAPSGACPDLTQVGTPQKKSSNLPWLETAKARPLPFCRCLLAAGEDKPSIAYGVSSRMEIYFKGSLEGGRGPGRRGTAPEEGRLKAGLLDSEKSQLQKKTGFTCKGKLIKVSLWFQRKQDTATEFQKNCFSSLICFSPCLPDPTPTYTVMHPTPRCHPTTPTKPERSLDLKFHSPGFHSLCTYHKTAGILAKGTPVRHSFGKQGISARIRECQ